jgi:MoaA/NifB/PqqE/SkfB family radical SAM enzyme
MNQKAFSIQNDRAEWMRRDEEAYRKEAGKRAVVSYPPRWMTIGIGSACTNRCLFCSYHSREAKGRSNVYGLSFKLELEAFQKMVRTCYEGRVPRVHVCGTGEPFVYSDIFQYLDDVIDVYGTVSTQTNFHESLFRKTGFLERLIDRRDHIAYISTDVLSGIASEHDRIKRGASHAFLLDALERLARDSGIPIHLNYIVTVHNHSSLPRLIRELNRRNIRCHVNVVNLIAYGFNDFTSPDSVYRKKNEEIRHSLLRAKFDAASTPVSVRLCDPFDEPGHPCLFFWKRMQTWPVRGVDPARYGENVIIGACNAVVRGALNSLGYFFDYDRIMDLWNNAHFVRCRELVIRKRLPDPECRTCQYVPGAPNDVECETGRSENPTGTVAGNAG